MIPALVEFVQHEYLKKDLRAKQAITDYHDHLAQLQSDYPLTWKEKEPNLYGKHISECPPCFTSIFTQALKHRIEEKDIESMIADLKAGKEI